MTDRDVYLDWLVHENFAEHKRSGFQWMTEYVDLATTLTRWALTALDDPPDGCDQLSSDVTAMDPSQPG